VVSRILRGKDMTPPTCSTCCTPVRAGSPSRRNWPATMRWSCRPSLVAPRIAELQASDDAYYAANGKILRNPTLINFLDGCAVLPAMRRAAPRSGFRAGSGRR
jgi:aspartyl-tRNA(Asn)/glutamyl-tRNA(Gln) amidotransferase subunit A